MLVYYDERFMLSYEAGKLEMVIGFKSNRLPQKIPTISK